MGPHDQDQMRGQEQTPEKSQEQGGEQEQTVGQEQEQGQGQGQGQAGSGKKRLESVGEILGSGPAWDRSVNTTWEAHLR